MSSFVRVVVPLPIDKQFTYRVPDDLTSEMAPGLRVLVPFGSRVLTGIVVETQAEHEEDFNVKPIREILDDRPALTGEMLELSRWMADYYLCGWGEVTKAALPGGTNVVGREIVRPAGEIPDDWSGSALESQVLEVLQAEGSLSPRRLRNTVEGEVDRPLLRGLEDQGLLRIESEIESPRVTVKQAHHVRFAPAYASQSPDQIKSELPGHRQKTVVDELRRFERKGTPEPSQADLLDRADASHSTLQTLLERGIVERVEKEMVRTPFGDLPADPDPPPKHELTPDQQAALDAISSAVTAGKYGTFLLHGVTGSGKTEVYIRALKQTREKGQTGIVLVPEIALTPQTVNRFRSHFGDAVAVLHSQMSTGERFDTWRQVRDGRYSIVIGPRSAVLAPVQDLGLIVVDEEHESSYKQFDPAPRYHARDVAVMRCQMNEAVCILGSATPSLESYANAERGKYERLELPRRISGEESDGELPPVRTIDLRLERKKHRLEGALSEPLREAIRDRIERGEQVILLQNRRGYAPVLICSSCGWSPECRDCSVTLTYHKSHGNLHCHYCGLARPYPNVCQQCAQDALEMVGAGTQRIEEEIEEEISGARVERMDRDTTSKKRAHRTILERFAQGKANILLGTQMIAKGLDFDEVTLVGVVDADTGMLLPDFRAGERTFQLLTQVAGRAGRREKAGEVLLQSRNPDHAAIRHASKHDYEGFVAEELKERRMFGYPPFGRMINVEFRGGDASDVLETARNWTDLLRDVSGAIDVLGPEETFIGRVKGEYRYHTVIKAPRQMNPAELRERVRTANERFGSLPSDCRMAIDVDPVGRF